MTILIGVMAGMIRLWMRAAALASQQNLLKRSEELSLSDVLPKAHNEERQAGAASSCGWSRWRPKRRKLLVSKLEDTTLAAEALRIATAIGMTAYVAERAVKQGILSLVAEALGSSTPTHTGSMASTSTSSARWRWLRRDQ